MTDFKENTTYIHWRYYVDTFIRNTEIEFWLDSVRGLNLKEVADKYFEFLESNNITEYREMFFLGNYKSFDYNYIHEIIGAMLKLKNSKPATLLKLYNGFKNYIGAILGTCEHWKGLDYELRHPFYADSYENTMSRLYKEACNKRRIVRGSQLWIHIMDACDVGLSNVCGLHEYFVKDNMPMLSNLITYVGCYTFLRHSGINSIIEEE